MSSIAISELNSETTNVSDNDLLLLSKYNSGNQTYTSTKLKATNLKNYMGSSGSVPDYSTLTVLPITTTEETFVAVKNGEFFFDDFGTKTVNGRLVKQVYISINDIEYDTDMTLYIGETIAQHTVTSGGATYTSSVKKIQFLKDDIIKYKVVTNIDFAKCAYYYYR